MLVPLEKLAEALAAPFELSEVKFKPAVVSGNRAMALAYVDARVVADRLDDVFGVDGWQDDYEPLADGNVLCRLKVKIGDEWIGKTDVGGPSEQPDGGDRVKAAFSDALKRTAVKLGIGRYLYRLPTLWVDYDTQKRQFVKTPTLPAFAQPAKPAPAEKPPQKPATPALEKQSELITEAQCLDLKAKLQAANVPWGDFSAKYRIARLSELPAIHLADALRLCQPAKATA